jgi:hypothetical protein
MPHSTPEKRAAYLKRYYTPAKRALAALRSRKWYLENLKRAKDARRAYAKLNPRPPDSRSAKFIERNGGRRALHIKYRYGVGLDELQVMLDAQDGRCGECCRQMLTPCINRETKKSPIKNFVCRPCFCRLRGPSR